MANVEITGTVYIGRRKLPLKKSPLFLGTFKKFFIEATAVQLRIMAYGIKDLLIDKILAQSPLGGRMIVKRLSGPTHRELPEPSEQKLSESDPVKLRKTIAIPPRDSDPATIERIPFKVVPLSEDYQRRKVRKKLDVRTFISTGDYLRGIVVRTRLDPKAGVTYVVTMANRVHKATGIRLNQLALLLEYGTGAYTVPLFGNKNHMVTIKMPARPHWRPAYIMLQEAFAKVGKAANAEALRKSIAALS